MSDQKPRSARFVQPTPEQVQAFAEAFPDSLATIEARAAVPSSSEALALVYKDVAPAANRKPSLSENPLSGTRLRSHLSREARALGTAPQESPLDLAMRALATQYERLMDGEVEAIEPQTFATAWETARQFREISLVSLVLSALSRIEEPGEGDDEVDPEDVERSLVEVIIKLGDFCFRFLTKRQTAFVFDLFAQHCGSLVQTQRLVSIVAEAGEHSPYQTPGRVQASVLGVTGEYRFNPQKLVDLDTAERLSSAGLSPAA